MSTMEYCGITSLLKIFLETNKHEQLMRLRLPIAVFVVLMQLTDHSFEAMPEYFQIKQLFSFAIACSLSK